MKKSFFIFVILLLSACTSKSLVVNDVSRLNPTTVHEIARYDDVAGLQQAVMRADKENLKVSIAGKKHSQGGHAFYTDSVVLDMLSFNKVLSVDAPNKLVTVQSGATWEKIQEAINPYNLSVKVMQSSNIFTVGGSLSVNAHGRDPGYGPIIETVRSFRLLLANGAIVNVSRENNPDLFSLVIGGYGLFGIILDVDLELTDNFIYESSISFINYTDYRDYFLRNVRGNPAVGLHFARLSIAPESLLQDVYSVEYLKTDKLPETYELQDEEHVLRDKLLFDLSREGAKELRWELQKKTAHSEVLTRNNAMRPPIKFLEYYSVKDTDILQEYFIPVQNFVPFIDKLREIVQKERINLLSVTIRYIPANNEAFLSYSPVDSFSVVLYVNQELSDEGKKSAEKWTQKLVGAALALGGRHYLAYQLYPAKDQVRGGYSRIDEFFARKKAYDSKELFMNKFYEHYK
jgi:FAD/FMN-containing dehydrogenase